MASTWMTQTPAAGLSSYVALAQSCTAPNTAVHGTGLPFAGTFAPVAGTAAVAAVRNIDLPGSPPRGAPV